MLLAPPPARRKRPAPLSFHEAAQLGIYTVRCARCKASEERVGTDDWTCRHCQAPHRIDPLVLTFELVDPLRGRPHVKPGACIYAVAAPLIDVVAHPLHGARAGSSGIILAPWQS